MLVVTDRRRDGLTVRDWLTLLKNLKKLAALSSHTGREGEMLGL